MKLTRFLPVVALLAGYGGQVLAYELETHADMSKAVAKASALGNNSPKSVLRALGLQYPIEEDIKQVFPNTGNTPKSILELIRDGSRFEDGNSRPLNHFFDPLRNKPLNIFGITLFNDTSPDWALEDNSEIVRQDYSLRDARNSFFLALTSLTKDERDKNFGLTFQSIGQVIHHLHDMAQPQHVRNDQHLDSPEEFFGFIPNPLYNPSLYEKYTDESRTKDFFTQYLVAGVYPQVTFPKGRDFWHTENRNPVAGKGIAEFTNRNFVSAGTNFTGTSTAIGPNPDYPKPDGVGAAVTPRQITDPDLLGPNQSLTGEIDFIGTQVDDLYRNIASEFNTQTSSYSLFDADLTAINADKTFTLNRFNFDAAHTFLIPRAVGYSAGLIDYFFRGKIDFVDDPTTPGMFIIKNLGNETMTGTFTLYYDAVDGKRYPVAGDAPDKTWAARTIAANGQLDNLTFIPPANPAPKWSDEYMLVFNGDMGEEKALGGGVGAVAGKVIGGIPAMPRVAAGTNHVLMTSNGQVKATGSNGAGQLGHDNSLPYVPYRDVFVVDGLDNVTNVAAIRFESFALKRDGSVWGWGLSAGSYIPVQVPGLTNVKQISGAAALKKDGTVWVLDHAPLIFSQIPGLSNVKRIAGGRGYTRGGALLVALLNDGSVYVYGDGDLGIFGDGSFGPGAGSGLRKVPITDVVGIAAGLSGVLAWKTDGTLWGWGFNYDRQLGVNIQILVTQVSGYGTVYCYCNPTPAQVTEVSGVTSAVLGRFFSLVNENSSKVWKMGDAFSYPYYPRVIGTNYTDEMAVTDNQIVLVNADNGAVTISTTLGVIVGTPVEGF